MLVYASDVPDIRAANDLTFADMRTYDWDWNHRIYGQMPVEVRNAMLAVTNVTILPFMVNSGLPDCVLLANSISETRLVSEKTYAFAMATALATAAPAVGLALRLLANNDYYVVSHSQILIYDAGNNLKDPVQLYMLGWLHSGVGTYDRI